MAAATPMSSLSDNGIPSELVIEILTRLPSASAVARCRCVATSWRSLLSDPDFLLKIFSFSFQDQNLSGDRALMIIRQPNIYTVPVYSLRSADAFMAPFHAARVPLLHGHTFGAVGYGEGIFCLSVGGRWERDLHLWNPATSETKLLRRPSSSSRGHWLHVVDMFGFDPASKDFKVVRIYVDLKDTAATSTEVYSLRNDSWGDVAEHDGVGLGFDWEERPIVESRGGRCYRWQWDHVNRRARILCCDLTREALSVSYVAPPRGRRVRSMSISKGFLVTVAVAADGGRGSGFEVWVAMGFECGGGGGEWWLKVVDVPGFRNWVPMWAAWADNKCFYLFRDVDNLPQRESPGLLGAFDLKTRCARDFGIHTVWNDVHSVITYVKSEISLSSFG